jgi:DNA-binding CsgD family transcriptional regulator
VTALGYALFLVLNSFSLWSIPTFDASAGVANDWSFFHSFACHLSNALCFFVVAAQAYRRPALSVRHFLLATVTAYVAGFGLLVTMSIFALQNVVLATLSGACIGAASALCFFRWAQILQRHTMQRAKQLILLATLAMPMLYLLYREISFEQSVYATAFGVLPLVLLLLAAAGYTQRSHKEVASESGSLSLPTRVTAAPTTPPATAVATTAPLTPATLTPVAPKPTKSLRAVFSHLWIPLACIIVISLIAPLVTTVASAEAVEGQMLANLTLVALVLSTLILAVRWLIQRKQASISSVYLVMVPAMATALLLLPIVSGEVYRYILFFIGTTAFCLASIIILISSIAIARESGISLICVFGLMAGTLYLAHLLGWGLGGVIDATGLSVPIQLTAAAFLLMYGLSLVGFFMMQKSRRTSIDDITGGHDFEIAEGSGIETRAGAETRTETGTETKTRTEIEPEGIGALSASSDTLSKRCLLLSEQHELSGRVTEVLEYLVHGRSIKIIAQSLYLSENTVRTHAKKLYQVLDVHTRQELIDLVESIDLEPTE